MGVESGPVVVPRCANPFEFVLGREPVFMVAPIVDIDQLPILKRPFKCFDIPLAFADPEDHEQVGTDHGEFCELGLVIFIQILEIFLKPAGMKQVNGYFVKEAILIFVYGKNIGQTGLGFKSHPHFVPENETIAP